MKPPPSAALAEVLEFKRAVNADRASGTPLRGGFHRRTARNRLVRSRGSRAFREDKVRSNSALWSMAVVLPAPAVLMRFCSRFVRAFDDCHLCKRQIEEGRVCWTFQHITPFSPSRPARGYAVLASALRAALTAALRRVVQVRANPPR